MNLLLALSLAGVLWCLAGAIISAAYHSFFWAMVSALLCLLCLFFASREWDAVKLDKEWRDAYRNDRKI